MRPLDFELFCALGFMTSLVMTWSAFLLLRVITVRRLRRDLRTRDHLGLDIFPGWQTWNVATTLSWPQAMGRYFDSRPLAALRAHSRILYANTSRLDRCLARACHWSQILMMVWMVVFCLYDWLSGQRHFV